MQKRIYLDYAAGTPVREEVQEAMDMVGGFANPSALYKEAEEARETLEDARKKIAYILGVKDKQVIFTSSSTEANNLAILGWAKANSKGNIISTPIEHPSILEPVKALGKEGYRVDYLDIDKEGFILRNQVSQKGLMTFAWANSDIGVVQPVREIATLLRSNKSELRKGKKTLHIDASQVAGVFDLKNTGADMVTVSSSKIYGPKGIAALIVGEDIKLEPIIYGGGQEMSLRSGTENVVLAVGFTRALELAQKEKNTECERLIKLRDHIINTIKLEVKDVILTGPSVDKERLPNHVSLAFKNIEGEELVLRLDERGFAVGTGSACLSARAGSTQKPASTDASQGGPGPSYALQAIGIPEVYQKGHIRISLGKDTSSDDVEKFVKKLIEMVKWMNSVRN